MIGDSSTSSRRVSGHRWEAMAVEQIEGRFAFYLQNVEVTGFEKRLPRTFDIVSIPC